MASTPQDSAALREVLSQSSLTVAPMLLGAVLSHMTPAGVVAVRISEVEAYVGDGADPGSHAFRGRTKRNASMYGSAGHLYAYFTYGMHVCANVTCSPDGEASAVLIRAGSVVRGLPIARSRRGSRVTDQDLARGPARLVVSLGIALEDDGADLLSGDFDLTLPENPSPYQTGPRTGLSGPGGSLDYPWRFWIPDDPSVSLYRRHPRSA